MNFPDSNWQWLIGIAIAVIGVLVAIWAVFKGAGSESSGNTVNINGSANKAKIKQSTNKDTTTGSVNVGEDADEAEIEQTIH